MIIELVLIGVVIILSGLFSFAILSIGHKEIKNKILVAFSLNFVFHFANIFFYEYNGLLFSLSLNPFFSANYGPLLWLYILYFKNEKKQLNKFNYFLFIPSLLFLCLSVSVKLNFQIISIITITLLIINLSYLAASFTFYKRNLKNYKPSERKWLKYFLLLFSLLILFTIINFILSFTINDIIQNNAAILVYVVSTVLISYLIYYSLVHPEIYQAIQKKYLKSNLSNKESLQLSRRIETYLINEKQYLEFDFSLDHLSKALSTSSKKISQAINQHFNKNFYELINEYRIEHAKELLNNTSENSNPIKHIMYDSGFNTKTTFNKVFKDYTGLTPSEFRKK